MRTQIVAVGVLLALACSDQVEDAQQAVNAAKAMMEATKSAQEAGEAAEKAAAEAEAKAREQIPEGATEEEAAAFVDNAKAVAALQAMGKAGGKGPITNWRQLATFLPDKLGEIADDGDLDGATTNAGGMKVTNVKRRYKGGDKVRIDVTITDTFVAPMLRAPFAMAALVEEDTSRGYKKGTKLKGHTAIVEWRKQSQRSHATLMVGERFVVDVKVRGTDKDDHASDVVGLLDLDALAKVEGKAEGGAAKPADTPAE